MQIQQQRLDPSHSFPNFQYRWNRWHKYEGHRFPALKKQENNHNHSDYQAKKIIKALHENSGCQILQ